MQMPGGGLADPELLNAAYTREIASRTLFGHRYYEIDKWDPASQALLPLLRTLSAELPFWDMPQVLEWYERFPEDVRRQYRPCTIDGEVLYTADDLVNRAKAIVACNDRFYLLVKLLGRVDLIHTWLFDRCREVEDEPYGYVDLWARFHGKAVDINEVVPTPAGWRRHGDIKPGDQVFGLDGKPTRVIARTRIFRKAECFRVTFDRGQSVTVSGDHLWTVSVTSRRRIKGNQREKNRLITVDTRELRRHVAQYDTWSKKYGTRPFISVAAPLEFPSVELPVRPYALGAWLGDGFTSAGAIACGHEDVGQICKILRADGHSVRRLDHGRCFSIVLDGPPQGKSGAVRCLRGHRRTVGNVYRHGCRICKAQNIRYRRSGAPPDRIVYRSLHIQLRDAGLLNNKHIPEIYQAASIPQRIALLQGLMDTDGTCDTRGTASFGVANQRLARDFCRLAIGLGLKPKLRMRRARYKGKPYRSWEVAFQAQGDFPVFRLPRKQKRAKNPTGERRHKHHVVSVKRVKSIPCSCLQVANTDGLYLIGEQCIPTHNSSIITTAGIIQEIIRNPEVTVCIFSQTRGLAQEFLAQIKNEFETNEDLKTVFYDVLYHTPRSKSEDEGRPAKWSLARGITVKRKGHPKEATVEAHGLIDGQPTGRHFNKHYYDDIVTPDNLTEEQLKKTTQRFEMADNLGTRHGVDKCIAGTRYHFADTYGVIVERGSVKARIYPATVDGTVNGQLVLISPSEWERIKRDQGLKTVSAQMLLNPLAGNEATFRSEWLSPYEIIPRLMNVYILVDPSKGSGERSDRTAIAVIGIDPAFNMYLIDGVCHRMRLTERLAYVERFKAYWENFPGVQIVKVGWERYGKDAEMEAVELLLRAKDNFFPIEELNTPKQGGHSKIDRIERLEPTIRGARFHLPCVAHHQEFGAKGGQFVGQAYWKVWSAKDEALWAARQKLPPGQKPKPSPYHVGQIIWRPVLGLTKLQEEFAGSLDGSRAEYGLPIIPKRLIQPLRRRDENKEVYDLTRVFMEEMIRHPYAAHDDLLDAVSRIFDIEPLPPQAFETKATESVDVDDTGIDPGAPETEQDL